VPTTLHGVSNIQVLKYFAHLGVAQLPVVNKRAEKPLEPLCVRLDELFKAKHDGVVVLDVAEKAPEKNTFVYQKMSLGTRICAKLMVHE
jgi:hypothetical protein